MNDFQQQLKDYKKEHFNTRTEWTVEDVKELLYNGTTKSHTAGSNRTMLAELRSPNNRKRNKFIEVIKEYERDTGKKVALVYTRHKPVNVQLEAEPLKPEPATETVVEDFAAEVERQPQTEFELKTEAFKTLFVGGMSVEKISKVLGLDDKVTNAMMVVIDYFKL